MSKFSLYPCALTALSALLLAADEKEPAVRERAPAEAGTLATFSWVDIEGDGRLELAAVSAEGAFQLKELREQDAQRASELKELRARLARLEGRVAPGAPPAAAR